MTEKRREADGNKAWKNIATVLISILLLLLGAVFTGLINQPKAEIQQNHKELCAKVEAHEARIMRIETNYEHIVTALEDTKQFMRKSAATTTRIEQKLDDLKDNAK